MGFTCPKQNNVNNNDKNTKETTTTGKIIEKKMMSSSFPCETTQCTIRSSPLFKLVFFWAFQCECLSTDKEINKDLQNTDLQNIFFNGNVIKRIARHRHYQMSALLLNVCGNFFRGLLRPVHPHNLCSSVAYPLIVCVCVLMVTYGKQRIMIHYLRFLINASSCRP